MSWLHLSWLGWIAYSALALIGIGAALSLIYTVMRAGLWCLTLAGTLVQWGWRWLWDTPPDSHGTAHFADAAEIHAAGLLNATGLPLAHTAAGQVLREPVSGHVALIAPARSHKSWGVIMPCLCDWRGSCVVNDLRGELFIMTHEARESVGPVFRFAPTERESCDLNPLDLIRWGQDEEFGDLLRVSTGLLSPEPGEPWGEYALEAVPFLVASLVDRYAHGEGHLGAVLSWLDDPTTTLKVKLDSLLKSPHALVARGASRMRTRSEARQGAILQALESSLNVFADPLVSNHTSRSDIDLNDLQHGSLPVSLFLCSPFSEQRRLRPLWACLLEQLIARFSAQGQVPRHQVLLCLDEAMNLGKLPELETGMSYLTGCGVQVLLAFQNRRQALHTYGAWSPILDSVPTTIYYTPVVTDRATLEEISQALGVTTAAYETRTDTVSAWGLLQRQTIGSSRTERPLMTPDEVARMPDDACLALTKGHPPVLGLKLDAMPSPVQAVVQRAKPVLRKVVALAGAFLISGSLMTWALWPVRTPPPRLALTSEVGGTAASHPAAGMTTDPAPEARTNPLKDWPAMPAQEPKRAILHEIINGQPRPWGGMMGAFAKFPSLEACEAQKARLEDQSRQFQANTDAARRRQGLSVGKPAPQPTLICASAEDQPS